MCGSGEMARYSDVAALLKALGIKIEGDDLRNRLVVQKVVYLAQACFGLDLGYKFKWYSRGPYSRGLGREFGRIVKSMDSGGGELEWGRVGEMRMFIDRLRSIDDDEAEVLEIAASLAMLCRDIYPPVQDPVAELLRRKGFLKKEVVDRVWEVVRSVCCLGTGGEH